MATDGFDHPAILTEEPEVFLGDGGEVTADPDAPFGRTISGKPRKGPGGRPPGAKNRRGPTGARSSAKPSTPRTAPAPGAKKTSTARSTPTKQKSYVDGIASLVDVAFVMGRMVPSETVQLDLWAIRQERQAIGELGNQLVHKYPAIAPYLDKIIAFGPNSIAATGVAKPLAQIAENHGWLPPSVTRIFGAVPRAQHAANLRAEATRLQAEAEAELRATPEGEAMWQEMTGQAEAETPAAPFLRSEPAPAWTASHAAG